MVELVVYAPIYAWVRYLCQGWRFPELVVEPMKRHHGAYSVLLVKDEE